MHCHAICFSVNSRHDLSPVSIQFYPIGSAVLALYPQTTCFYPAEVSQLPTEVGGAHPRIFPLSFNQDGYAQARPSYMLHFDDDDYEDGRVRFQVGLTLNEVA
jgi:hypothetical protein